MLTMKHYRTPDKPELLSFLPVDNVKRVLMSLPVPDCLPGDVLICCSKAVGTNDSNQWAFFPRCLILGASAAAITGELITEDGGENFNPVSDWISRCDVHHLVGTEPGSIEIKETYPIGYVNYVVRANTSPSKPQNKITMPLGYGFISVTKLRQ